MTTLTTVQNLLVEKFDLKVENLQPESELDKAGLDSLAIIECMFMIEDIFKLKMPDERVPIQTVQDIVTLIDRLATEQHGKTA